MAKNSRPQPKVPAQVKPGIILDSTMLRKLARVFAIGVASRKFDDREGAALEILESVKGANGEPCFFGTWKNGKYTSSSFVAAFLGVDGSSAIPGLVLSNGPFMMSLGMLEVPRASAQSFAKILGSSSRGIIKYALSPRCVIALALTQRGEASTELRRALGFSKDELNVSMTMGAVRRYVDELEFMNAELPIEEDVVEPVEAHEPMETTPEDVKTLATVLNQKGKISIEKPASSQGNAARHKKGFAATANGNGSRGGISTPVLEAPSAFEEEPVKPTIQAPIDTAISGGDSIRDIPLAPQPEPDILELMRARLEKLEDESVQVDKDVECAHTEIERLKQLLDKKEMEKLKLDEAKTKLKAAVESLQLLADESI